MEGREELKITEIVYLPTGKQAPRKVPEQKEMEQRRKAMLCSEVRFRASGYRTPRLLETINVI